MTAPWPKVAGGRPVPSPRRAVLGAQAAIDLGVVLGSTFVGSHGLGTGGEEHGEIPYVVVGVLHPTQSVLDRLVLTATESVWAVHEHATATDEEDLAVMAEEREVTMLLVKYRSPLAAVSVPRWINSIDTLQSASPALESARLLRMVGVGVRCAARLWHRAAAGCRPCLSLWRCSMPCENARVTWP